MILDFSVALDDLDLNYCNEILGCCIDYLDGLALNVEGGHAFHYVDIGYNPLIEEAHEICLSSCLNDKIDHVTDNLDFVDYLNCNHCLQNKFLHFQSDKKNQVYSKEETLQKAVHCDNVYCHCLADNNRFAVKKIAVQYFFEVGKILYNLKCLVDNIEVGPMGHT